jgi:hypothetical protein
MSAVRYAREESILQEIPATGIQVTPASLMFPVEPQDIVEQTPMLYLVCIIGSQSASITNSF